MEEPPMPTPRDDVLDRPTVRIRSLTTSGGDVLDLPMQGVTCIVGGNNVGKSTLLRDIANMIGYEGYHAEPRALSAIELHKDSIGELQARAFLESHGVRVPRHQSAQQMYMSQQGGGQTTVQQFLSLYHDHGNGLSSASQYFVWHATAGTLSGSATGSIGAMPGEAVAGPLARLYRDPSLEEELCRLAQASFGQPLLLDTVNLDIQLRVGDPGTEPGTDYRRPRVEYANAVRDLPALSEQGDGIKSFFGLALNVIAGSAQVLLIDEPEAFLHPSQARALGRWLGEEVGGRDLQVLVATHDKDFVLGLVESAERADLTLVRLTRDDSSAHVRTFRHDRIEATWNDAVLRYSNVLQGLFHSRVAIAEGDADCRFYGAALDQLGNDRGLRHLVDDVLFVPSGGKEGVPAIAQALVGLGVETFAIVDFDVLNNKRKLKSIVEAVGSDWDERLQSLYRALADFVNGSDGDMWADLKVRGLDGLPGGSPFTNARDLIDVLRDARVLVVPVGEMESFDRTFGGHGSPWVNAMLASGRHVSCEPVRALLAPLIDVREDAEGGPVAVG